MSSFFTDFLPLRRGILFEERIRPILKPAVDKELQELLQSTVQNGAANAPIDTEPPSSILRRVKDAAKKTFTNTNTTLPLPPPFSLSAMVKGCYQGALALGALFIAAIYSSKQLYLQNINLTLTAAASPKIYNIAVGTENGLEIGIAFELIAGKPLNFLVERDTDGECTQLDPLFSSGNLSIGPLKQLIWMREEPHTEVIITIEDPFNQALKSGPEITSIRLSEREGFTFVRIDPTLNIEENIFGDSFASLDSADWAQFSSLSIRITEPIDPKHATQIIPLPFSKRGSHYLSVTQIFPEIPVNKAF